MVKHRKMSNAGARLRKMSSWFQVPKDSTIEPASYKTMMRYAEPWDYVLLVVGVVSSFLNGIIIPLNMIAFQSIVNVLIQGQLEYDAGALNKTTFSAGVMRSVWIYFSIGVGIYMLTFMGMGCLYTLCERQVHRIRKHFLQSILNQDMEWFDHNEIGALTHKMSSTIEKIKDGASDKIGIVLVALGSVISGIVWAFLQSWRMTLIVLVIVPFVVLTLYGSARALSSAIHKEINTYSAAGAIAEEVLTGIRTVMAFNAQTSELERYEKVMRKGASIGTRKVAMTAFFTGIFHVILFAAMGVTFWYGTLLAVDGDITSGTVFSVFWAVLIGAMRLGQAVPQLSVIVGARIAAGEIFAIIDRKPKLDCASKSGHFVHELKGHINFSNIFFHYPSRPDVRILNGVSLTIEPGQTVAFVGHSGCGKSTLIGLLMRYYQQETGSISIDGVPIEDLNVELLRRRISVVSQEPVLFKASVGENLRMGKQDATQEEMEEACRAANAHDFVLRLPQGYDTVIGDGGVKLSGGQKQRIAIARALIRQPKVLLLDEATSALDTESERLVQTALDNAAAGRTTITIAHRLSTVRNADRIVVFDQGQIVESGTHDELMEQEKGTYRQLVLAQQIATDTKPSEPQSEEEGEGEFVKAQSDRASSRLQKSMASVRDADTAVYLDDAKDELETEGSSQASLMEIARFARPEMKAAVAGMVMAFLRGFSWPIFSVLYGRLFLILSSPGLEGAIESAVTNGIGFVVIGVVCGFATFGSGFFLGSAGERVSMRLRLSVYWNLLRQDASYFDKPHHSVGILTSRLAQDASNVQAAIDQRLAEVLQGITGLIVGIGVAFTFGWNMAPFCIFVALILVLLQTLISSYLKRRGATDAKVAADASRLVTESIENVRTVQALTRQEAIFAEYLTASREPHRRAIVRGLFQSCSYAIASSFIALNFFACYLFGLWLVMNDYSTPFAVFQVIEALNMAAVLISNSASYFPEYIRARISAGLMFGMMATEPKIDNMSEQGDTPLVSGHIEFKDVRFAYPNGLHHHPILNGLSITAKPGQTVALVGPSGCGKSTAIQLIERYYDTLSGALKFDGRDVRQLNLRHLRRHIGLVGQEPTLFNLSIRDNIAYGLDSVPEEHVRAAARLANIDKFVESLPNGYGTSVGERGSQLSGGQKQRIAIARAVVREPRILLLDEATAALDGESERIVQEALDRARSGRTCIVIAHRLSTIQNADIICVVDNGKCVEAGDHRTLLERHGLYYRLVKSQNSEKHE